MSTPSSPYKYTPWVFPVVSPELVTKEWCTLHRLIEDLSLIQRRLGTPLEEPDDYMQVRELGHKICNKLHLVQLWAELGMVARSDVSLELSAG